MTTQPDSDRGFSAQGGWWVAVQFPLLILAYLIPEWYGRALRLEPDWVTGLGVLLLVTGALLFAAAAVTLGPALTPFPRPLKNAVLRTRGVYGLVRHPIYTAVLLMAIGWSLYQYSPLGLVFDAGLLLFFDRKAAREERWLVERFAGYPAYRRRVKKLIPWIY